LLGRAATGDDKEPKKEGGLDQLSSKVQEIVLANGLRVLVLERHDAPVIAFANCVNVGSVDENTGETGLAHMFEHMAFKGSTTVGSTDWPKEKIALEKVENAFLHMRKLKIEG